MSLQEYFKEKIKERYNSLKGLEGCEKIVTYSMISLFASIVLMLISIPISPLLVLFFGIVILVSLGMILFGAFVYPDYVIWKDYRK